MSFRHAACICLVALPALARGEEWPGFRGPTGQGLSSERSLPTRWSATENVAWKTPIPGEGWSSPVIWGDRIFLTATSDKGESCHVLALSRLDGKLLWNVEVFRQKPRHRHQRNSFATPSTVTDGERVYAVFCEGGIAALTLDGKKLWENHDVSYFSEHGLGGSPVLYQDLLIMTFDGSSDSHRETGWKIPWEKAVLLALDKKTGKESWRAGRGLSRIAHTTPIFVPAGERVELVTPAGDVIQGFDPKTGKLLWTVRAEGEGIVPSPVLCDGLVVACSGSGKQIRAVKFDKDGDDKTRTVVWESSRQVPFIPSPVYVKPYLFLVNDSGIATCLEAATGKVLWEERLGGKFSASPVYADGLVYFLSDEGDSTIVEAKSKFVKVARNSLNEPCQASMAISRGQLFIRTAGHLYCIGKSSTAKAQVATPRQAVAKSLSLLWKGADGHIAQRDCFACHNQAIPILALTAARERGFSLPEQKLSEQREFIATFLDKNRDNYMKGKGQGGQVDTAGWALFTLELCGQKRDDLTAAVVEYLLLRDSDQDHWRRTSTRPPSEASDFTSTYVALQGLRTWASDSQKARVVRRIEVVREWLRKTKAVDTEERVFRLYALQCAGANAAEIQGAVRELIETQQPDGGWAQVKDMTSDAYATGSVLTALHKAGGISTSDPAYARGVAYLLRTQNEDGSWLVVSRSKPFQTYYESGFPHDKNQFISMAATAWATTALALACPPNTIARTALAAPTVREAIPDKLVVLTFDDSSKTHFTVARPLLKKLGFGATFFITEGFDFPTNKRDYMTWEEIAELHRDGFEIGNHTTGHMSVTKKNLSDLAGQVRAINDRCKEHGIPAPVSFAYPGNSIDPGALPILHDSGIAFARRGGAPEYPYKEGKGFAFEPGRDHPLLIPSAGDARPTWTVDDLRRAVEQARAGRIAVLQFHGVPDTAHSWVNTPQPQFEAFMRYLADNHYKVIAMRDLKRYVGVGTQPADPFAVIAERRSRLQSSAAKDEKAVR